MARVCLKSDWSFLKAINKVFFGCASPFQTFSLGFFQDEMFCLLCQDVGCQKKKKNHISKSKVTINC